MPNQTTSIGGQRLTSPDRVLWEEQGVTKRELAEYYQAVGDWLVPELRDRPLTLIRCPQGQERKCFVQRRASDEFPAALKRVAVEVEEEGATEHLAATSLRGVLYLAQIGVLEIHTWSARRDRLDRPDRLIFDLDPDPALPFGSVVDAALQIRGRLEELGLRSFVKTSGGKGLHLLVPIRRGPTWEMAREFSGALAREMESRDPRHFVAEASKSQRSGRVYVDYLRNGYGATAVCAYSPRARPGAPVSTPLAWDELAGGARPEDFDLRTVPDRLRSGTDPWSEYRTVRQALSAGIREKLGLP